MARAGMQLAHRGVVVLELIIVLRSLPGYAGALIEWSVASALENFDQLGVRTFGSDWPYEFRPRQSHDFTARLDAFPMPEQLRAAVDRRNAEALFPRLARTGQ
jgi:hypothetical protein